MIRVRVIIGKMEDTPGVSFFLRYLMWPWVISRFLRSGILTRILDLKEVPPVQSAEIFL